MSFNFISFWFSVCLSVFNPYVGLYLYVDVKILVIRVNLTTVGFGDLPRGIPPIKILSRFFGRTPTARKLIYIGPATK
jgi:hypothetical protein